MPLILHTSSVTCVGNRSIFLIRFSSNINNVVNITSDVLLNFIQLSYFHKIFLFVCNFQGTSDSTLIESSGEYEIRTRDLLLARQALSQLS